MTSTSPVKNNASNLHIYYARNFDTSGVVEFKGGTTLAFYAQPDGDKHTILMYALSRCHENDGFEKKIGRELAVIRLSEAPTFLKTDFPGKFLVSKEMGDGSVNYRLPSSKIILTMFANVILEHFAQELQDKAFSMMDYDMYSDLDLNDPQIIDAEHAKSIVDSSTSFIRSLGSGAAEHDLAS